MKQFPANFERLTEADQLKFRSCQRQPTMVKARQMKAAFIVTTRQGQRVKGDPGDYLICGVEDNLYRCSQQQFDKLYRWRKVIGGSHE